ncbi:hypothetical protein ACIOHS_27265 [Streptomyces sp. NPDC088253]|uniref:hypothetical protein n=1 Tax=Streptomyces sp. NPDC088253 TaxID=3365846 RepID=UPI003825B6B3
MSTYEDVRAKGLVNSMTETITGVPLKVNGDNPLRRAGYSPILVCVTDPCDGPDDLIVWVPQAAVQADVATGRQNRGGEEVHEYAVSSDTSVVVEEFRKVKVGDMAQFQQSASRAETGRSSPVRIRRSGSVSRNAASDIRQLKTRRVPKVQEQPTFHRPCNDYEIDRAGDIWTLVGEDEDGCTYVGPITFG